VLETGVPMKCRIPVHTTHYTQHDTPTTTMRYTFQVHDEVCQVKGLKGWLASKQCFADRLLGRLARRPTQVEHTIVHKNSKRMFIKCVQAKA